VRLLRADEHCPRNDGLFDVCHNHQNIRRDNSNQPKQAEYLLPEHPPVFVFHPLEEEFPERVERRLMGEAIINVLVVCVRFEPESVSVGKEQQAEEQKDENKSKRGFIQDHLFQLKQ